MIITGKDLDKMKELNCGNCIGNTKRIKLPNISCRIVNKVMNKNDCCVYHFLEEL